MFKTVKKINQKGDNNISIGINLKKYREKANLTQNELAKLIGVQCQTVWRWEHEEREPSLDLLKKLANALNVTEDELLNGNEKNNQWILQIFTADKFKEAIDLSAKKMNCVSQMTITPDGAGLLLTGNWDIWGDQKQFKNLVKQLEKARDIVLQNGKALGSIKD